MGLVRRDHPINAAIGPVSPSNCRRTASGASCSSLAIWSSAPSIVHVRCLQIRLLVLGRDARKRNGAVKGIARGLNQVHAGIRRNPLRHYIRQATDQCERANICGQEARRQCIDVACSTPHDIVYDDQPLAGRQLEYWIHEIAADALSESLNGIAFPRYTNVIGYALRSFNQKVCYTS